MNREGLRQVVDKVSAAVNLPLTATADFKTQNSPIVVRIAGLSSQDSFSLVCQRSPMTWIVEVQYDLFAQLLIDKLLQVAVSHRDDIIREIQVIESAEISVETNLTDLGEEEWATRDISKGPSLKVTSTKLQDQTRVTADIEIDNLYRLISNCLILLSLLLSDFGAESGDSIEGDEEGELTRIYCNSYSRSARNRARCLEAYGYTCRACLLTPESIYGQLGRSVIHVHHRTPVSMMESVSKVDPVQDLVPLCPNCHNFAHKRTPPFSPEEIQSVLRGGGEAHSETT